MKTLENKVIVNNDNEKPFNKMKISELKVIIKKEKKLIHDNIANLPLKSQQKFYKKISNYMHDFALVGSKSILLERVEKIQHQHACALNIQKNVRRLFVKQLLILRGPATLKRSLCNNETDFCTLQPVEEIELIDFFSYKSNQSDFIYGFDINSLLNIYKRKRKLENPYTRETMEEYVGCIKKMYRLNKIIWKDTIKNETFDSDTVLHDSFVQRQNIRRRLNSLELPEHYNANEVTVKLRQLREKSIQYRINNIFTDIDSHGHYTDKEWFISLNFGDMMRLFRIMRDIWNYRSRLPFSVKLKICPLWDPFVGIVINYRDIVYSHIQKQCLTIIEDLIYMGIDEAHQNLGIFQFLTALTFVSLDARRTMPWLYESIF
jgi:hypothetical protein